VILLVDNYDSFTYNLVHLLQELGAEVVVRRNDEIDADGAEAMGPSHVVISPGPGRPAQSGATLDVVRRLAPTMPTLACATSTPPREEPASSSSMTASPTSAAEIKLGGQIVNAQTPARQSAWSSID